MAVGSRDVLRVHMDGYCRRQQVHDGQRFRRMHRKHLRRQRLHVPRQRRRWRIECDNGTDDGSGAPTLNLTTTQANSAIVVANVDWTAVDGASRVWRTNAGMFKSRPIQFVSPNYTVYGGYHADAGALGTYAVGLSAPSTQRYVIGAVEVKGSTRTTLSKPPNNLGLVGYWSFNEGTGTTSHRLFGEWEYGDALRRNAAYLGKRQTR